MSNHPLKMADKLKGKKRPTANCRIFVGDAEALKNITDNAILSLIKSVKDYEDTVTPEMSKAMLELFKAHSEAQEPFFQKFVFKAMPPVAFEDFAEEHSPREGSDDIAFNYKTFPTAVFRKCLIEPVYSTLTDEEWDEFLENCSQKERRLLLDTAMNCNLRSIEPSTPKDLTTL